MTLGIDYRLDQMSAIGMSGSYFVGGTGISGGSTNARAGILGLYGPTQRGPIYFDGFVDGGLIDYRMTRGFDFDKVSATASAAPDGHLIAFGADAGYHFEQHIEGGPVRWGPVGRLRFNNVAIGDYSESGFGSLASDIRGRDANSLQTGLGVEASFEVPIATGSFAPHLRATWQHEFADITETAVANFSIAPGDALRTDEQPARTRLRGDCCRRFEPAWRRPRAFRRLCRRGWPPRRDRASNLADGPRHILTVGRPGMTAIAGFQRADQNSAYLN